MIRKTIIAIIALVVFYLYTRYYKPQVSLAPLGDGKFAYRFAAFGKYLEGIFNINNDAAVNYSTGKARFKLYLSDVNGLVINAEVLSPDEKDSYANLSARV